MKMAKTDFRIIRTLSPATPSGAPFFSSFVVRQNLGGRYRHRIIQMLFYRPTFFAADLYPKLPNFHCERFDTFLVLTSDRAYFADRVVYVGYFGRHCFHVSFDVIGKRI